MKDLHLSHQLWCMHLEVCGKCQHELLCFFFYIANNELKHNLHSATATDRPNTTRSTIRVNFICFMFVYVGFCLLVKKVILFARVCFMSRLFQYAGGNHFEFAYWIRMQQRTITPLHLFISEVLSTFQDYTRSILIELCDYHPT